MRRVVDTNVAVVANGRAAHASVSCRLATLEFLDALVRRGRVVLDADGAIQQEYRRHLSPSGQPGVGDRFFQLILQSAPSRVERIELAKNELGEFVDFPEDPRLATFDSSDRKFAAAARKAAVPVANAVDSDWLDHLSALEANGIAVEFVCGADPSTWQ
jgi:hypothetical protein